MDSLSYLNSEDISKMHMTESSVPTEPDVDLDFRDHLNRIAQ